MKGSVAMMTFNASSAQILQARTKICQEMDITALKLLGAWHDVFKGMGQLLSKNCSQ